VDATSIPRDRAGVGRYLSQIIPALAIDERVGLTVVAKASDVAWLTERAPGARVVRAGRATASRPLRLIWEQLALPFLARRHRAHVVFSPHYTVPVLSPAPVVVCCHDATFFTTPELHEPVKARFFRVWTRIAVRRARAVVVPSASARDEIFAAAGGEAARFHVAYHGIDGAVFHPPAAADLAAARELVGAERWIAFLGTREPRKNLPALIRAFVAALPALDAAHPGIRLAIAGASGWDPAIDEALAEAPAGRVGVLGYVPDDVLPGLLGGALLVAYPSLGEGFGLPVAEAMACGAAVLTTPRLSLPEVGGEVAAYAEPDSDALRAALERLLLDDDARAERARRGPARAALFTWTASADAHVAAFEAAAGPSSGRAR